MCKQTKTHQNKADIYLIALFWYKNRRVGCDTLGWTILVVPGRYD